MPATPATPATPAMPAAPHRSQKCPQPQAHPTWRQARQALSRAPPQQARLPMPMGPTGPRQQPEQTQAARWLAYRAQGATRQQNLSPETPRTTAPDTYSADQPDQMGVHRRYTTRRTMAGYPGRYGSTSSTGGTSSAATAPGAPSSSTASVSPNPTPGTASDTFRVPSTAPSTPAASTIRHNEHMVVQMRLPSAGTSWRGDTRKISDQADDFGMGQGSTTERQL